MIRFSKKPLKNSAFEFFDHTGSLQETLQKEFGQVQLEKGIEHTPEM